MGLKDVTLAWMRGQARFWVIYLSACLIAFAIWIVIVENRQSKLHEASLVKAAELAQSHIDQTACCKDIRSVQETIIYNQGLIKKSLEILEGNRDQVLKLQKELREHVERIK